MRAARWALAAGLLLVVPGLAAAQEVRGTVMEAATGAPIGGARVTVVPEVVDEPEIVELTLNDGTFQIRLRRAGRVRVYVEQLGYGAWSSEVRQVDSREPLVLEVELEPRAIEIEGIDVGVTARGDEWGRRQFERRRDENDNPKAIFLDPIHIALADARHPVDFLRAAPGFIIEHDDRIRPLVGRCVLVYLDHIRLPVLGAAPRGSAFGGVRSLGQIVGRREIRAIEIYSEPSAIPAELMDGYRATGCALVQIWTWIGW